MIDASKLKYFKILCEKGVLDEQQNDLDEIINALEEKQFEYLKRLETTKDESRKEEINELLNIIDMELRELAAIKTTLSLGVIASPKDELEAKNKAVIEREVESASDKTVNISKKYKGGRIGIVIAAVTLLAVVTIVTILVFNGKNSDQNNVADDKDTFPKYGLYLQSDAEIEQEIEQGTGDKIDLGEGVYILGITNPSLDNTKLEPGDRIAFVNGMAIKTPEDLETAKKDKNPGDELSIIAQRGDEKVEAIGSFVSAAEERLRSDSEVFELEGLKMKMDYETGNITYFYVNHGTEEKNDTQN